MSARLGIERKRRYGPIADGTSVAGAEQAITLRPDVIVVIGLLTALVSGPVLRLVLYCQGRSLLIDEARLSLNIASRSFFGLVGPLDHDQSAPILFLWIEKGATILFGVNEYSLRLFPLLAG